MSFSLDHHFYSPTAYRKVRPVSVSSSGFHSQHRRRTTAATYSQPSSIDSLESHNGGDVMARRNEKEMLQTLNDRFAGYIDKVRNLELHNRNLEAEAAALRQNQAGRAAAGEHYERELAELRSVLRQLTGERARTLLQNEHLEEDVRRVRGRLEDEARAREEADAASRAAARYADECRLSRSELDRKLGALEEEEAFLRKNHEEEVAELLAQIQGAQVSFEGRHDSSRADVTAALREIRSQLDGHASRSSTQAEEWFKVRMEHLSEAARSNQDAIRGSREEIAEYRRQLQSRTIELETLRGTKDSLERQRMESEDRHHGDLGLLQETIHQLDNELKSTKWEMANQLKDYQDLLNVKMALDIEIAAYRKLLEGEENRFVSGGTPFSYLDSRISAHLKLKGEEISDTVIVEEQTDETQVTEVTEEADEEEEEEQGEAGEEGGEEEQGEDTKEEAEAEEAEEGGDDKEGEGEGEKVEEKSEEEKEEKQEEEEAIEEKEKSKSPEKAASPQSKSPAKSPQPKSPVVESPESKSPESKSPPAKSPMPKSPAKSPAAKSPVEDKSKSPAPKSPEPKSPAPKSPEPKSPAPKSPESKSPAPKSPVSKSPAPKSPEPRSPTAKSPESKSPPSKSPESKSPPPRSPLPKTPEPKSPDQEKVKTPAAKETPKEEKTEEKPQHTKEEKEKPEPVKEEPKEKEPESKTEKADKPDTKKESKKEDVPKKKEDTPKPAASGKHAEDKPALKAEPKESPAPSAKKEEKPAPPKTDDKVLSEEKSAPKVEPEKAESKKEEKIPEEKKVEKKEPADSKDMKEGGKTEKAEKSSGTEVKEIKEEKAKK